MTFILSNAFIIILYIFIHLIRNKIHHKFLIYHYVSKYQCLKDDEIGEKYQKALFAYILFDLFLHVKPNQRV